MSYPGTERRQRTVYVTTHHEYHLEAGVCVAVRDTRTTVWISRHAAVGLALVELPGPIVGRPLLLRNDLREIVTSEVIDVFRPGRQLVDVQQLVKHLQPAPLELS